MLDEFKKSFKSACVTILPITVFVLFIIMFTPVEIDISISFILSSLLLIFGSALFTFGAGMSMELIGNKIGKDLVRSKKIWLGSAITLNLLILFFYKYYGFVTDSIVDVMSSVGFAMNIPGLDLLLPVGISFYIFQALGYSKPH